MEINIFCNRPWKKLFSPKVIVYRDTHIIEHRCVDCVQRLLLCPCTINIFQIPDASHDTHRYFQFTHNFVVLLILYILFIKTYSTHKSGYSFNVKSTDIEMSFNRPSEAPGNPGSIDDIHRKCVDLFSMPFDGLRIIISNTLSKFFLTNHQLEIGSTKKSSTYTFETTYLNENTADFIKNYNLRLSGNITPLGAINTYVEKKWHNFNFQLKTLYEMFETKSIETIATYYADRFTTSVALINPNLFDCNGIIRKQFLYAWNVKTSIGFEIYHENENLQFLNKNKTTVSVLGRYLYDNNTTISYTLGLNHFHCCYHFQASQQLEFGVELLTDFLNKEFNAKFGYQVIIPQSNVCIKGSVDTKWNICVQWVKAIYPFSSIMTIFYSPSHNKLKIGLGLGYSGVE